MIKNTKPIKYSICVVNYNMGSVIEKALLSVLNQIDNDYEIVVIDDGSSDNSLNVLKTLSKKYELLRYVSIKRDRKRMLGETRNISIREARGEYILLNIDADDIWEPYIKDFVRLYHNIEDCYGEDFVLSGNQIGIGKKDLLLRYGPYRNTFVEDRDLWHRLAAVKAYLPMYHKAFRVRMPLPKSKKIYKAIWIKTWNHMLYDLRRNNDNLEYILGCISSPIRTRKTPRSFLINVLRMLLVFPVYFVSKVKPPLLMPENFSEHSDFVNYRDETNGTYAELMERRGGDGDISFLSKESRNIFE